MMRFGLGLSAVTLSLAACADATQESRHTGAPGTVVELGTPGSVGISVHARAMETLREACYDLRVTDSDGAVLASFGDPARASRIAYDFPAAVAGADATLADALDHGALCVAGGTDLGLALACEDGKRYRATLWLHDRYEKFPEGSQQLQFWSNPCPPDADGRGGRCELAFECHADRATQIVFDLSVIRDSRQGFFDVAITFGDIYCSGHVATCRENGDGSSDPLMLLADPTSGEQLRTAVLSFACSGAVPMALYAQDLTLSCYQDGSAEPDDQPHEVSQVFDLTAPAGPQPLAESGNLVKAWHIARGVENLDCGAIECRKFYWNAALAVDALGPAFVPGASPGNHLCHLRGRLTAVPTDLGVTDGTGGPGFTVATGLPYPEVVFDVRLTDRDAEWDCRSVPIPSFDPLGHTFDVVPSYGPATGTGFCGRLSAENTATRATSEACQDAP